MAGPNYVLDKGFNLSNGGAAQSIYRFMKFNADENKVIQASAITDKCIGVCQQRVDAADSATGNVQVDVRMMGISKVEASAAIALGAEVAPTADGRAQTAATTQFRHGVALQAATGAGQWIDVFIYGPAIGPAVP
jgi:hypothetical protein